MPKDTFFFFFDAPEVFLLALFQEIFQGLGRPTETRDRNLLLLVVAGGLLLDAIEEQTAIVQSIEVVIVWEVLKGFPGCFFSVLVCLAACLNLRK